MNCIEFESAVERSIESRQPLAQQAVEHTASCVGCRRELEILTQLDSAISVWKVVAPAASLTDNVLAQLSNSVDSKTHQATVIRSRQPVSQSGSWAVMAAAACLLIVAAFGWRNASDNSVELVKDEGNPGESQIASNSTLDVKETLTEVLLELRSEYHEIASETSSVARDLANAIPLHVPVMTMTDELESPSVPNSSDVKSIWNPIGSRVGSAFGFLWQAVPNELPAG